MELQKYEKQHLQTLEEISSECALFLKRSNSDFPLDISSIEEIGLYGNGVRHTLKGGTGSGNVESHIFNNIEQAFENRGIKVLSKAYLDKYDEILKNAEKDFVKLMKKKGKQEGIAPVKYFFGKCLTEPDYDLSDYLIPNKVSIYVLSRKMGEGNDRENIKGQYKLSDTEINTIKWLKENSKKFLLVLNVGAPIDISDIGTFVDNILLISYLGQKTSETLVHIVLGETYPSGKLPVTWDKYENYPSQNFGDINETYYKEGVFVGYRYFTSINKAPMYPFGFGLGYTDFQLTLKNVSKDKDKFTIYITIKNVGQHKGKEVAQIYLSKVSTKEFPNPAVELVGFKKSKELLPTQSEEVSITFSPADFANFDEKLSAYVLKKGIYLIKFGNDSSSLQTCASFEIEKDIVIQSVKRYEHEINVNEDEHIFVSNYKKESCHFIMNENDLIVKNPSKTQLKNENFAEINKLSNDELILMCMGNISSGMKGMIGDSCESVLGGAGETCLNVKSINKSLVLADGPAGVRITSKCLLSKNKKYKLSVDPMWEDLSKYLPKFISSLVMNKKNQKRKGERYYQYTTSIPVANALASSFSEDVVNKCGLIIADEMLRFGVGVILSPSMNIVRNPLCGRNFEYYSEDPYLTSKLVSQFVNAVQSNGVTKACIKHYLCNNQENNRFQSNSIVSIRTIREIYLRPFLNVVSKSSPYSLMTSYNLVNGEHSSESSYFIKDVLREEMNYCGLIMTDWISSGTINNPHSKNETVFAYKALKAGVNLLMPGGKSDIKNLKQSLKKGLINRDLLLNNVNFIYKKILDSNKAKS